jgi:hypothetical protein
VRAAPNRPSTPDSSSRSTRPSPASSSCIMEA